MTYNEKTRRALYNTNTLKFPTKVLIILEPYSDRSPKLPNNKYAMPRSFTTNDLNMMMYSRL